ncbi:50S ribosomal protein L11 methyltransferase [Teredinibacter franksiae]|uniref:50S ribosomal protein L11 methyltransferase n=1 Tax=Teredinibacter franksiae TaxID=2761453 RepID=UPI0035E3FA00
MPWLQLRIDSSRDKAPIAEDALLDSGSLAVTLEDNANQPIFEPQLGETPLWRETRVTGLYEADIDTKTTLKNIQESYHQQAGETLDSAVWRILEDKDWEREWMSHYHPIQCADNLWICPSWTPRPTQML